MGHLVTKKANAQDKSVKAAPRVHGTSLQPTASDPMRKGNGNPFHLPRNGGSMRPFGPSRF